MNDPRTAPDAVTLVGAGGHAKVVLSTLRAAGIDVDIVLDDSPSRVGSTLSGHPVHDASSYDWPAGKPGVIGIGDNRRRGELVLRFPGVAWISVVHPAAWVEASVRLGHGTIVMAGAVIQPDCDLGDHVIVNTGASLDHDCVVASFVHAAPGSHVAGEVRIGEGALLGIGASVTPGVSIGSWTTIGAGAAVVTDVGDDQTVGGVPARSLPREQA